MPKKQMPILLRLIMLISVKIWPQFKDTDVNCIYSKSKAKKKQ